MIADFGGAMGLMLGLNVLDVLVFSGSIIKLIAKKLRKGPSFFETRPAL